MTRRGLPPQLTPEATPLGPPLGEECTHANHLTAGTTRVARLRRAGPDRRPRRGRLGAEHRRDAGRSRTGDERGGQDPAAARPAARAQGRSLLLGPLRSRPTSRPPPGPGLGRARQGRLRRADRTPPTPARRRRSRSWTTPGATYQAFWATNAIRVDAGDQALVDRLAGLTAVAVALADPRLRASRSPRRARTSRRSTPSSGASPTSTPTTSGTSTASHGEGIVVANIDTGVQYDHPALVGPVPRQQRRRHLHPRLQLVRRRRHLRRTRRATPTATAPTRWARWSATTARANQIGVAPGAKWIAANGCCPSDAALIASGEWMLAPTDLEGENPDVTKRPNIINNSWGTQVPSNDPFMEDVQAAWAAVGHLRHLVQRQQRPVLPDQRLPGQPDHQLLGRRLRRQQQHRRLLRARRRPGRRDQAEHLGARRQRPVQPARQHATARSTARRWPRRTWPARSPCSGRPRRRCSATSTRTRALLDDTAIDSSPTTCGGTADDNNVFGEGRLDALALLERGTGRRHRHRQRHRDRRGHRRPDRRRDGRRSTARPTAPSTTGADGTLLGAAHRGRLHA